MKSKINNKHEFLMNIKNEPKPPIGMKIKKIERTIREEFVYKLKIKYNDFMNKYYYGPRDILIPKLFKNLEILFIEILKFIKLTLWSIIIMFILLLFGYNLTLMNFLSSVAICVALTPIAKFILKTKRIED